jgi:hypothetical protein
MNTTFTRWLLLAVVIILADCADPREDNLFDTANSFVRFNYDNTVTDPARDAVTLDRDFADPLYLPLALSAPPQPQPVRIDFTATGSDGLTRGTDFVLLAESGAVLTENQVQLEPGDFDYVFGVTLTGALAAPATLTLELTGTEPDFLLGFPGSGRGRIFTINFE